MEIDFPFICSNYSGCSCDAEPRPSPTTQQCSIEWEFHCGAHEMRWKQLHSNGIRAATNKTIHLWKRKLNFMITVIYFPWFSNFIFDDPVRKYEINSLFWVQMIHKSIHFTFISPSFQFNSANFSFNVHYMFSVFSVQHKSTLARRHTYMYIKIISFKWWT